MAELSRQYDSHLRVSLQGWDFAASYGDVMVAQLAAGYLNAHRDEKKHPAPFEFQWPWPTEPREEDVTPEERARLKALLQRHSAFADRS